MFQSADYNYTRSMITYGCSYGNYKIYIDIYLYILKLYIDIYISIYSTNKLQERVGC